MKRRNAGPTWQTKSSTNRSQVVMVVVSRQAATNSIRLVINDHSVVPRRPARQVFLPGAGGAANEVAKNNCSFCVPRSD